MQHLGFTRSTRARDHLLQTPDTFIRAPFPGMINATAIVHASPALGAAFVQYTAEMGPGGALGFAVAQRFLYVIAGQVHVEIAGVAHLLPPGGYAFMPENSDHRVTAAENARLAVIEKTYYSVAGIAPPCVVVGEESSAVPHFLMNDPWLEMRTLLPPKDSFDCAVNVMTFQPGASLPMVEMHVMEHGLLMLEGGGIYRLSDCWYPVSAGDFIWMAPGCPQWFCAVGKTPARYLIYKDFNRAPRP